MGLFSSTPAADVCGIAIHDYGLHLTMMACDDRSTQAPVGEGLVSMLEPTAGDRPRGLDETVDALAGGAGPLLRTDDQGTFGRSVTVTDEYESRLNSLYDRIEADNWDGDTVVSLPPNYSSSAQVLLETTVEDAGFDVRQVVSHDVASSVLGAVNYRLSDGDGRSHPVIVVDFGCYETTVTLAAVSLDDGRVRVRARDHVNLGALTLLNRAAENALLDLGVPEESIDLEMLSAVFPLVRDAVDPETDEVSGRIEIGGEQVQLRVGVEHYIQFLADLASVVESFAGEFVHRAGYEPREVVRVMISGVGSEGAAGFDLIQQIAAQFVDDDAVAAEIGGGYSMDSIYYGNEILPHIGAADMARVARDVGRDIEVLETLDVEAA